MIARWVAHTRSRPYAFAAILASGLLIGNIVSSSAFISPGNWPEELAAMAPFILVAFASTPAILSGGGGLDLSIGPLAVLCNTLLVQELLPHGIRGAVPDILILVTLGTAVGAINGLLVTLLRYRPVIATLCTTFVVTGIAVAISATPATPGPNWTVKLAGKIVGPVPGAVVLMLIPVVVWVALSRTHYHRNLYGAGGNDVTAFSAGIDVTRVRIIAYALGGAIASVAGIAITAFVQANLASSTSYYILIGITGVALGGTPVLGGRGGMTGAFFGATSLYLIQTLLSSTGVAPDWTNVLYGGILFASVTLAARATTIEARRARLSVETRTRPGRTAA